MGDVGILCHRNPDHARKAMRECFLPTKCPAFVVPWVLFLLNTIEYYQQFIVVVCPDREESELSRRVHALHRSPIS